MSYHSTLGVVVGEKPSCASADAPESKAITDPTFLTFKVCKY